MAEVEQRTRDSRDAYHVMEKTRERLSGLALGLWVQLKKLEGKRRTYISQ